MEGGRGGGKAEREGGTRRADVGGRSDEDGREEGGEERREGKGKGTKGKEVKTVARRRKREGRRRKMRPSGEEWDKPQKNAGRREEEKKGGRRAESFIRSGRQRGQRKVRESEGSGWEGTQGIILFHLENNEESMHLSGVAVLTAPLCFHLLSPSLSVRLHVEHVNRFAHS